MSSKVRAVLTAAVVVAAAAGGFLAGRGARPAGLLVDAAEPAGPAVARFRGWALPADVVAAQLAAQPARVKEALRAPEARKAWIEGLTRSALFAREAERRGLHLAPAFLRRYEEELGKALVQAELEGGPASAPADDEVRRWYDANAAALARPERVRVGTVAYLATDGEGAARRQKRAAAERALSGLLRRGTDPYAFANLARTESEDLPARATNGELPFATREELAQRLGPEVADAAFAAREAGAVVPAVIETPRGFYLVRLLGREAAYAPGLDEVKEAIRGRLAAERRARAYEAFVQRLSADAGVRLDDQAIAALRVE